MSLKKTEESPIKTILVISIGMLFVHIIFKWQPALYIAFGVGVLGLVSAYLASKIEWLWLKLSYLLSLVIPNVLMSAVFYLILTPVALLSKVFGAKDPLKLKNTSSTVYSETNKEFKSKSFDNPW